MIRLSPEARAKLAEGMRARRADPAFIAKLAAERAERNAWTPEQVEVARRMAADGASMRAIGLATGVYTSTARKRCQAAGIDTGVAARRLEAGAEVLRQHYASDMPPAALRALYGAAREVTPTPEMIYGHAKSLGLARPECVRVRNLTARREAVAAERAARMVVLAERVQRHIDAGLSLRAAAKAARVGHGTLADMRKSALVTVPARVVVRAAKPDPEAKRRAKDAADRAMAVRLQAKLDAGLSLAPACASLRISWDRGRGLRDRGLVLVPARVRAVPPPKPKVETVEAFLAGGGAITRCPAAYAAPTTGGEVSAADAARLRAHAEAAARELARHGGNSWKAARAAQAQRRAAA